MSELAKRYAEAVKEGEEIRNEIARLEDRASEID
jgi:hypothetical protein